MRKKLKEMRESRCAFTGIFERYGIKRNWHGFPEKTVLLKSIRLLNGEMVADHLWFNYTKGFQSIGDLKPGDTIKFDARVSKYQKGYAGFREELRIENPVETDYRLSYPTNFELVQPN